MKNKYIPCELKVVEFQTERPFAVNGQYGFTVTNTQKKVFDYVMMTTGGKNGNGTQNQQYTDAEWGSGAELWE